MSSCPRYSRDRQLLLPLASGPNLPQAPMLRSSLWTRLAHHSASSARDLHTSACGANGTTRSFGTGSTAAAGSNRVPSPADRPDQFRSDGADRLEAKESSGAAGVGWAAGGDSCIDQIHPSAIIHPGAKLSEGVRVGPFCVVGPNAVIGPGVTLHSHVVRGQTPAPHTRRPHTRPEATSTAGPAL